MFWDLVAASNPHGRAWRLAIVCLLACGLGGLAPQIARADDGEAAPPAPRTAIEIGGASIVLVAAADHLYAFIDRIEDNAPVTDAELGIDSADGTTLQMSKAADGLFIAPFNRAGHMHDAFMVTLHSATGSGDAQAEIAYTDVPEASAAEVKTAFETELAIALVSGGIGAIGAASMMLWLRGGFRRVLARSIGPARTT